LGHNFATTKTATLKLFLELFSTPQHYTRVHARPVWTDPAHQSRPRESRIDKFSQHQRNQYINQGLPHVPVSLGPMTFTTTINNKTMTLPTSNTGPTDRPDHSITHRTDRHRWPEPNSAGKAPGKIGQVPGEKSQQTHASNRLRPHRHHPLINQYNPCRGSSIGRACGSYQQQRDQPQGRGFEPHLRLFLSYKLVRAAVLLHFCCLVWMGGLVGGGLIFGEGVVCWRWLLWINDSLRIRQ
jgi:hypothetical protein